MADEKTPTVEHDHDHDCAEHDHDHAHDHHDHEHDEERIDQQVTIEEVGPARKKLNIEIPADYIAKRIELSFADLREEASIPGFRRGKAPMSLLQKKFGNDVRSEVKSQLIGQSYAQIVEEKDLRVIGSPDIKDPDEIELPTDGPMSFSIEIEVAPEFELPDLEGIEIKKPLFEVTDEQVEAELTRYRDAQGNYQPVDGAAEHGDYLTADLTFKSTTGETIETREGAVVSVPGKSRKFKGVLGGIIVEDLGKKLEGIKAGETRTVLTTGPKQHENEAIRDQEIAIDVTVQRVERIIPLELSELVTRFGFESEEEMRNELREQLGRRGEQEQQAALQSQVVDALLEKTDFELPEGMSARQAARVLQRRSMDLMYRGVSQQDIEENLAELRAASEEQARRDLKQFFILDKVAEKLEVEVGQSEVNGRIAQMAIQQNRRPEKLRDELARSGQIEQLYIQLRDEKAVDQLIEKASIEEISADDWKKLQDEKAAAQSK